jgi:purine-cytosine permease-like protein
MKIYHYFITVGLCLWFIFSSCIAKSIDELVENFILFIVSLLLVLIAIFLDDYEDKRKSKQ